MNRLGNFLAGANPAPNPKIEKPLDKRAKDELAMTQKLQQDTSQKRHDKDVTTSRRALLAPRAYWKPIMVGVSSLAAVTVALIVVQGGVISRSATASDVQQLETLPARAPVSLLSIAENARKAPSLKTSTRGAALKEWSLRVTEASKNVNAALAYNEYSLTWQADGSGEMTSNNSTDQFRPGEFTPMFPDQPASSKAELLIQLGKEHPNAQSNVAELVVAIKDMKREWRLSGETNQLILQILSEYPEIQFDGTVKDRAGRDGASFSFETDHGGLPTRTSLIFDQKNGTLLGVENVLTSNPGALKIKIPSVVSSVSYM